jgi:hypothetical protein
MDRIVADELPRRLLEREVETTLAATAGRIDEVRGQTGLPRSCRARCQNRRAAIEAFAAKHRIQPPNSAGDSFFTHHMLQTERRDGKNAEAAFVNQERIFTVNSLCAIL